MPFLRNSKFAFRQETCLRQAIRNSKAQLGFSLIELLIVVTLFSISGALITAAYLNFERNQRLKNGALTLKSDIRLVQNKATSGDKGAGGACPNATSTLVGWYVRIASGATNYSISGDCLTGATEANFNLKTVGLPKGVSVSRITYGTNNPSEANILFRSLTYNATFHGSAALPPDFLDGSGNLRPTLTGGGTELVIELSATSVSGKYEVRVKSTGEVNEYKP